MVTSDRTARVPVGHVSHDFTAGLATLSYVSTRNWLLVHAHSPPERVALESQVAQADWSRRAAWGHAVQVQPEQAPVVVPVALVVFGGGGAVGEREGRGGARGRGMGRVTHREAVLVGLYVACRALAPNGVAQRGQDRGVGHGAGRGAVLAQHGARVVVAIALCGAALLDHLGERSHGHLGRLVKRRLGIARPDERRKQQQHAERGQHCFFEATVTPPVSNSVSGLSPQTPDDAPPGSPL